MSLLEILVVIALLAMLTAFLVPGYKTWVERTEGAVCMNNLRQIAAAGILHAQDRDGLLPDMGKYNSTSKADEDRSLIHYLGFPHTEVRVRYMEPTVFTCPTSWQRNPTKTDTYRTYGINRYATSSRENQQADFEKIENVVPKRLQAVSNPHQMAFFMDGAPRGLNPAPEATYYVDQNYARLHPNNTPYVHGDAIHAVFLDCHVERITSSYAAEVLAHRQAITLPFWGSK